MNNCWIIIASEIFLIFFSIKARGRDKEREIKRQRKRERETETKRRMCDRLEIEIDGSSARIVILYPVDDPYSLVSSLIEETGKQDTRMTGHFQRVPPSFCDSFAFLLGSIHAVGFPIQKSMNDACSFWPSCACPFSAPHSRVKACNARVTCST